MAIGPDHENSWNSDPFCRPELRFKTPYCDNCEAQNPNGLWASNLKLEMIQGQEHGDCKQRGNNGTTSPNNDPCHQTETQ